MTTPVPTKLVICAKSQWRSTSRREHLFAHEGVAHGVEVAFFEEALDLRALRNRAYRGDYLRMLAGGARPEPRARGRNGVTVISRGALAPGHRGGFSLLSESRLLSRDLASYDRPDTVVVATTPWFWPAVSQLKRARRVVDLGDDWSHLIPERAGLIDRLHARIGEEADAVIVAAPSLAGAFGDRLALMIRNGTNDALIEAPMTPRPRQRRLIYVGTLSERLDVPLIQRVLERLPGWTIDLYGPCQYAGRGGQPGRELEQLLRSSDGRAVWHGRVARADLAAVIDRGDVLLIPNRADVSRGQDSMKLYDYLARGRPTVATSGAVTQPAPGVHVADDPEAFAAAVRRADDAGPDVQQQQRIWAGANTYSARWPQWWAAVSGGEQWSEAAA